MKFEKFAGDTATLSRRGRSPSKETMEIKRALEISHREGVALTVPTTNGVVAKKVADRIRVVANQDRYSVSVRETDDSVILLVRGKLDPKDAEEAPVEVVEVAEVTTAIPTPTPVKRARKVTSPSK